MRNQESDGDTRRRDNDLDRFEPSDRRNTLRHVSLVYCIEYQMNSRGSLPALYSLGISLSVPRQTDVDEIWSAVYKWGMPRVVDDRSVEVRVIRNRMVTQGAETAI